MPLVTVSAEGRQLHLLLLFLSLLLQLLMVVDMMVVVLCIVAVLATSCIPCMWPMMLLPAWFHGLLRGASLLRWSLACYSSCQ
jgi:hypothetical protein